MSGIIILGSAGLAKEFYYYIKRACPYITDYIFVNDLDDGQTTLDIDGKIFEVIKDTGFDWHLADKITIEQKEKDIFFYLVHVFYNQTSLYQSTFFSTNVSIIKKNRT